MEMRQVRYFLALCEELNFTRAAKRCGVSQPSLSNAIRRLEEELGGSLFHRSTRRMAMSPLGVAVRPYFQQIDHCAEEAKRQVAAGFVVRSISTNTKERPMRKFAYGAAAAAAAAGVLLIAILAIYQPKPATSSVESQVSTSNIVDVRALERSIDVNALPDGNVKGGYGEEDN
jgi:DNA-binding transcriptional LysR family regulator